MESRILCAEANPKTWNKHIDETRVAMVCILGYNICRESKKTGELQGLLTKSASVQVMKTNMRKNIFILRLNHFY